MGFIVTTNSGFEGQARRELRKVYGGDIVFGRSFFKGVIIVENKNDASCLKNNSLIAKATKFDSIYNITKDIGSLYDIAEEISKSNLIQNKKIKVQCKRRGDHNFSHSDVEQFFIKILVKHNIDATKDNPDFILSIEIMQELAYIGLNSPENVLSNLIPQRRKYESGKRPVNRAEFKLREALESFNISLEQNKIAIDLGSAPGGWAKVLAEKGLEVIAIDPGELNEEILKLPNVKHFKCRAEDFVTEKKAAIITNDMNIHPKDSAAVMCRFARYLEDSGICIMTVKFVTPNRRKLLSEAKKELEKEFLIIAIKKMPHNGYETTLLLKKK